VCVIYFVQIALRTCHYGFCASAELKYVLEPKQCLGVFTLVSVYYVKMLRINEN